jgi:hypothetical protein
MYSQEVEHAVKQRGAENTYFMMSADPNLLLNSLTSHPTRTNRAMSSSSTRNIRARRLLHTARADVLFGQTTKEVEAAYAARYGGTGQGKSIFVPAQGRKMFQAIVTAIEESG